MTGEAVMDWMPQEQAARELRITLGRDHLFMAES